jgi:hypothetical protein
MPLCWPDSDGLCACPRGHIQKNSGKAPLTTHADKDATTDRAVIEGWWAEWPSANVGVALASSGLVAIDCDSSEALQEAFGLGLVPTVCRMSHWPAYIYLANDDTPKSRLVHWGESNKIDLLAGGYLVVHGKHQSGREVYLEGDDIAVLPPWVSKALHSKVETTVEIPPEASKDAPPVILSASGEDIWYGRVAVDSDDGRVREIEQVNTIDRSETLFQLGIKLSKANASYHTIVDALAERDEALGYDKYTDRKDEREYHRIAQKVGQSSKNLTSDIRDYPSEVRLPSFNAGDLKRQALSDPSPALPMLPFLGQHQSSPFIVGAAHLVSAYPKAGKTELLCRLVSEWCTLGYKVRYFSEESVRIWQARLKLAHGGFDDVTIVDALGAGRHLIVSDIGRSDSDVIVIDTMKLLMMENENDNSQINMALTPLVAACRASDKTLVIAHHTRKGGGLGGEAAAGGYQFFGGVDVGLELERVGQPTNRRKLHGQGRILDVPELLYERSNDGSFSFLGHSDQLAPQTIATHLGQVLTEDFQTTSELRLALPEPRPSADQVSKVLREMAEEKSVERLPPLLEGNKPGVTYKWRRAT